MERPAELSAKKARKIKNIVMKLLFFLNKVMRPTGAAASCPRGGTPALAPRFDFRVLDRAHQLLTKRR